MDSAIVNHSQSEVRAGVDALRRGRKDDAGLYFLRALQHLDDVQDLRERRDLLSEISEVFLSAGFEDLALMAVQDALEIDKRLGLERGLVTDSMTYANIHSRLENLEQAEATYRSLLERCLQNKDYANAASASTNLAGILANDNYLEEATQLLENSLEYLKVEPFPDTEINTRLTLIQVLEVQESDPKRTFDEARILLDQFADMLPPQYREILAQFVDGALRRYSRKRLDVDVEQWRKREFPELYGD